MPIAYFIASALLWSAIVITPEDSPEIIFILFTFLSFVLLGIYAVCITKDRVLIKSLGIEPPSSCWILFPPVYSLKRSEILKQAMNTFICGYCYCFHNFSYLCLSSLQVYSKLCDIEKRV